MVSSHQERADNSVRPVPLSNDPSGSAQRQREPTRIAWSSVIVPEPVM
jgi:hypothetical protein